MVECVVWGVLQGSIAVDRRRRGRRDVKGVEEDSTTGKHREKVAG